MKKQIILDAWGLGETEKAKPKEKPLLECEYCFGYLLKLDFLARLADMMHFVQFSPVI